MSFHVPTDKAQFIGLCKGGFVNPSRIILLCRNILTSCLPYHNLETTERGGNTLLILLDLACNRFRKMVSEEYTDRDVFVEVKKITLTISWNYNSACICFSAERVTSLGKDWHRPCLKCEKCSKTLSAGSHAEVRLTSLAKHYINVTQYCFDSAGY